MNVILQGIVGSHAYGLARAGSDIDHLGLYVTPTADLFGLDAPKETVTKSGPQYAEDITLHEIGKYCRLALQCNPSLLELLWLPAELIERYTHDGAQLRRIRYAFLSEQRVRDAFGGYAVQQAERLRKRTSEGKAGFSADTAKRTAKHARHCWRLLRQGRELLETGDLTVAVDDPLHYWAFDDMPVEAIVDRFGREFDRFAEAKSVLPEQPDRDTVNDYLITVRHRWI